MRTNVLVGKIRENRAVLYTPLRVCLVHNSMAFANQQGLYACVNVISIFHGKGSIGPGKVEVSHGICFLGGKSLSDRFILLTAELQR